MKYNFDILNFKNFNTDIYQYFVNDSQECGLWLYNSNGPEDLPYLLAKDKHIVANSAKDERGMVAIQAEFNAPEDYEIGDKINIKAWDDFSKTTYSDRLLKKLPEYWVYIGNNIAIYPVFFGFYTIETISEGMQEIEKLNRKQ